MSSFKCIRKVEDWAMNEKNEHHHRRQPSLTRPISLSYQLLPSLSPPLSFFQFQNSDAALLHLFSSNKKEHRGHCWCTVVHHEKGCLEIDGRLFQGANHNSSKCFCVDPWDPPSELVFCRVELNYCVRVNCTELTLDSWLEHLILNRILYVNKLYVNKFVTN